MSDFYYGQGKLYLARRNAAGQALSWRWVGDVSALKIEFETDEKSKMVSLGGRLFQSERFISATTAKVTSTWHAFSVENLSLLFNAHVVKQGFSHKASASLREDINQGDVIALPHTNVFNVRIDGLTESDFRVDKQWGMLEFLTKPTTSVVNYEYLDNVSIPFLTTSPLEYSLRFHGVNIAENDSPILVELYRLSYDPLSALELINSEDNLMGMETSAQMLADLSRPLDTAFGHFGRIHFVKPQPSLTYNGAANYDGKHQYRGK